MFDDAMTAETDPQAPRSQAGRLSAPWYLGALCGLLAGALAVGVGLLTAQWFSTSTPMDAVGSAFIDRVPGWLKRLAIDWFGTNDKRALRIGIYTVMGMLALVIGWRALRNRWSGAVGFVSFGALGVLCVLDRPQPSLSTVMPTVLAAVIGAAALLGLIDVLEGRWRLSHTPHRSRVPLGLDRRSFLVAGGSVAAAAAVTAASGVALEGRRVRRLTEGAPASLPPIASTTVASQPSTAGATGAPDASVDNLESETPFITPSDDFYRIDTAISFPNVTTENWQLRIHGMVDRELVLRYQDVLSRPQVERTVTLACVSNEVGGDLVGTATWQGVLLADLLAEVGVGKGAEQVYSTSADGWTSGFPVEAALDGREPMLAIGMNGKPLPVAHGFPARLVVPGLYGYVSATKWVTDIKLTTWAEDTGYWVPRGWSALGPVKAQSRIDVPRRGSTVSAGTVNLGGVAWAHRRGVARVEVQVNDGPWAEAVLDDRGALDTWRQWRYAWEATPGKYRVSVRTTDSTGEVQTDVVRPPDPDGATGHHTRRFTVA